MTTQIAYKRLYRDSNGQLWSYLKSEGHHFFGIQYHENVWVYPPYGKLFVFDTMAHCGYGTEWYEVWMVEADNCEVCDRAGYVSINQTHMQNFWCPTEGREDFHISTPYGTLVCDRLRLIKPMQNK